MAELPEGYREVPPEDRAKAKVFIDRGKSVAAGTGFEYAIEMYLQALNLDPDSVEAHQELREISFKRKVSGGKTLGMFEAMKLKRAGSDSKLNMLNFEKLLSYDPGNTEYMLHLCQQAYAGGYYDTVLWIGQVLKKANFDLGNKADFNKYMSLRDIYKALQQWRLAADVTQLAALLKPLDMDLATEIKNLGAMETMHGAGYANAGSFRELVRDMNKQSKLLIQDKDVADLDSLQILIAEAESEHNAEPEDIGKAVKLADVLEKTDHPDFESRAIELLQQFFERTKQFRFRQRIGMINMKQMARMEKSKREALNADAKNAELQKDWEEFTREMWEFELAEYALAAEAYPTDMRLRFEVGKRMFLLHRYAEAIPVFQAARQDPKYRVDAGIMLGCCFLNADFVDEADEILATLIKDYSVVGDNRAKEMYYWRGIALEKKNQKPEALSHYSKVAQWDFNYRDVQARMKKIRSEL